MRKLIYVLIALLMLTGCTASTTADTRNNLKVIVIKDNSYEEKHIYRSDEIRKIMKDAYDSCDKYGRLKSDAFNNKDTNGSEYFNELVDYLDNSIGEGIKDYINGMKNKELKPDEIITERIGKTAVFISESKGNEEKYIEIKIDYFEFKDEYYRDLFNKISDGKYILDNAVIGQEMYRMDFINKNALFYIYDRNNDYQVNNLAIQYKIYLKDEDIKKANVLLEGKIGTGLEQDDIDVFNNLLNSLELKAEEKDLLLDEYRNVVQKKVNKKISLDKYNILIKSTKGNFLLENNQDLIYFSIERK